MQGGQQGFEQFFKELREEAAEMGEENVSEEEARELWLMMKDELDDVMSTDETSAGLKKLDAMTRNIQEFDPLTHTAEKHIEMFDNDFVDKIMTGDSGDSDFSTGGLGENSKEKDVSRMIEDLRSDWRDQGFDFDQDGNSHSQMASASFDSSESMQAQTKEPSNSRASGEM